jgi:hypothetical protein
LELFIIYQIGGKKVKREVPPAGCPDTVWMAVSLSGLSVHSAGFRTSTAFVVPFLTRRNYLLTYSWTSNYMWPWKLT